ncbi:glycosyltransferase family 4 protein [Shewanella frigidimarina]|uniref:glycosyltransferase family 4 protein n=1 Tax=Shewanella frigidimarina TaxID=56812 RepID=UPI003D796CF9
MEAVLMRILIVSQYFWPENFRVNDLTTALISKGHKVTVLTGIPNYPEGEVFSDFEVNKEQFNHYAGAKVYRVPIIPRKNGKGFNLILNYVSFMISGAVVGPFKLRNKKFDKIFVFAVSPITSAIPAIVLGKLKKASVTVWVMDLWPETLLSLGVIKSGWQEKLAKRCVSFIYNHCTTILGQSHSFVTSIEKLTHKPVSYFPSWSDTIESSCRFEYDFTKAFNVVFAGNIGESQDFPSILKAAELIHLRRVNVNFLIVGDGRKKQWVENEINKRNLSSTVKLLGSYPVEAMPSLFLQSDALLVTLKSDPVSAQTIPGKIQSYLSSGKPILAMLDGEGANVIEEAKAGITVGAGDFNGLATGVEKMYNSSDKIIKSYGVAAKTYYMANFDRDIVIGKLIDIFKENNY